MPKPYVSIDLETTGLDPENCQILQVGLVIDDWTTPIEDLPTFEIFVQHDRIHGEPFALQMNAAILKELANPSENKFHCKPNRVEDAIAEWFASLHWGIEPKKIMAAGKNFASFDLQFLKQLPDFGQRLRFHHRSYDPAMCFMDWDNDALLPPMSDCMKRAGLEGVVAHTAVEDALVVVKLLRFAKERLNHGINPNSPYGQFLAATQEKERPEPRNGY